MKKIQSTDTLPVEEDMLPEYRFDYSKARPNRFATVRPPGSRTVVLDPDVAEVFTTQESVNAVLRALITTMPKKARGKRSRQNPAKSGTSLDK